jgi:hypothetical protein
MDRTSESAEGQNDLTPLLFFLQPGALDEDKEGATALYCVCVPVFPCGSTLLSKFSQRSNRWRKRNRFNEDRLVLLLAPKKPKGESLILFDDRTTTWQSDWIPAEVGEVSIKASRGHTSNEPRTSEVGQADEEASSYSRAADGRSRPPPKGQAPLTISSS